MSERGVVRYGRCHIATTRNAPRTESTLRTIVINNPCSLSAASPGPHHRVIRSAARHHRCGIIGTP